MTTQHSSSRTFWTFWSATTTSQFGSGLTLVAFPLIAVSLLDASAFEVSLLSAAGYFGWVVLGLPSGVIVQRLPLRAVQVGTDLVRAVAIVTIPLAYAFDALTVGHLIAVAVVVGCATVLFDVGNSTFLPAIVSREELTARNSLVSGTQAATQMGAPSVAGLLVQGIGAIPTLLFDVVSYLVSAVLLRSLPERRAPQGPPAPMWAAIAEGWSFVRRHPVMFPCVGWATVTNFACGALLALSSCGGDHAPADPA
ncbi:MAG: MFS transporter, partial [Comamonadaceae bacterium]